LDSESKIDPKKEDESSRRKEALDRMKVLNFVRAPHHIAPMEKKLDKLAPVGDGSPMKDPFAKKPLLGGK
jgi:hypothetical protein